MRLSRILSYLVKRGRFYFFSVVARLMAILMFGRYDPKLLSLLMGIEADPVLSNANRLASDAHLLIENKRYASALALGVTAFEEIGKYLLLQWSTDPSFKYDESKKHIMKQAAVAALFMVAQARNKVTEAGIDFENFTETEHQRLHQAIEEGMVLGRPFAKEVIEKVYENVKRSGLYYDPEVAQKGIEPSKVTEDKAKEIMALTIIAFENLPNDRNVYMARYVFPDMVEDIMQELNSQTSHG